MFQAILFSSSFLPQAWIKDNQEQLLIGFIAPICGYLLSILIRTIKRLAFEKRHNQVDEYFVNQKRKKLRGYVPLNFTVQEKNLDSQELERSNRSVSKELYIQEDSYERVLENLLLKKRMLPFLGAKWKSGQFKRVLILGGAGTGKSLLMYKMFKRLFNPFPFIFSKNAFGVVLFSMSQWEKQQWKKNENLNLSLPENYDQQRKCVVLIDGADEYQEKNRITNEELLKDISSLFEKFKYYKAVVISTRPIEKHITNSDTTHVELAPLQESQIYTITRKKYFWLRLLPTWKIRYKKLLDSFKENDGFLLSKICQRPLLLDFLYDLSKEEFTVSTVLLNKYIREINIEGRLPYFEQEKIYWNKKKCLSDLHQHFSTAGSDLENWISRNENKKYLLERLGQRNPFSTYQGIYNFVLWRWHRREAKKLGFSGDQVTVYRQLHDLVLSEVAFGMSKNKTIEIEDSKLQKIVFKEKECLTKKYNNQTTKSLAYALNSMFDASGINPVRNLSKRSVLKYYNGKRRFVHNSFKDYYTAESFLNQPEITHEVLEFLLALNEKSEIWLFLKEMAIDKHKSNLLETGKLTFQDPLSDVIYQLLAYQRQQISLVEGPDSYTLVYQELIEPLNLLKKCIVIHAVITDNEATLKLAWEIGLIDIEPYFHPSLNALSESGDLFEFEFSDPCNIVFLAVCRGSEEFLKELFLAYEEDIATDVSYTSTHDSFNLLELSIAFRSPCFRYLMKMSNALVQSYLNKPPGSPPRKMSLHLACWLNTPSILSELLLAFKGNKNHWLSDKEQDNWNALMFACRYGSDKMVEMLLNAFEGNKNHWLSNLSFDNLDALTLSVAYTPGAKFYKKEDEPDDYRLKDYNWNDESQIEKDMNQSARIMRLLLKTFVESNIQIDTSSIKQTALANGHSKTAELFI